jgi:glycosyltransferase involved in cell wall biosynthesis
MRIAIVSDYAGLSGGISVFLANLTIQLGDKIHFTLVCWGRPGYCSGEVTQPDIQIDVIEVRNGDFQAAAATIGQNDLVFLQTSWNVRLLALMASEVCLALGVPLVAAAHTTSHSAPSSAARPLQESWLARIFARSKCVICVSDEVRRSIERLGPVPRLEVIANASRYRLSDRSERTAPENPGTFTWIGRPSPSKGAQDFFAIARDLEHTGSRFVCNGLYPDILALAGDAPANVEFCHSLDRKAMLDLFCRSQAVVATYRHSEGLPLALLEALSLGVPVLGYASPGVTSLLESHGQFLAEVDDYRAIVQRIEAWHAGGIAFSPPKAEEVPHWSSTADQYLRLFQELVQ